MLVRSGLVFVVDRASLFTDHRISGRLHSDAAFSFVERVKDQSVRANGHKHGGGVAGRRAISLDHPPHPPPWSSFPKKEGKSGPVRVKPAKK